MFINKYKIVMLLFVQHMLHQIKAKLCLKIMLFSAMNYAAFVGSTLTDVKIFLKSLILIKRVKNSNI